MKCNKKLYRKKKTAQEIANHEMEVGHAKMLKTYFCENCDGWHLTSSTGFHNYKINSYGRSITQNYKS